MDRFGDKGLNRGAPDHETGVTCDVEGFSICGEKLFIVSSSDLEIILMSEVSAEDGHSSSGIR